MMERYVHRSLDRVVGKMKIYKNDNIHKREAQENR